MSLPYIVIRADRGERLRVRNLEVGSLVMGHVVTCER